MRFSGVLYYTQQLLHERCLFCAIRCEPPRAALREVREETGIEVGDLEYHCSRPNRYLFEETEYLVLDLFFVARMTSFAGAAALDEVDAVLEIPVSEIDLETIAFPSVKEALRIFRER